MRAQLSLLCLSALAAATIAEDVCIWDSSIGCQDISYDGLFQGNIMNFPGGISGCNYSGVVCQGTPSSNGKCSCTSVCNAPQNVPISPETGVTPGPNNMLMNCISEQQYQWLYDTYHAPPPTPAPTPSTPQPTTTTAAPVPPPPPPMTPLERLVGEYRDEKTGLFYVCPSGAKCADIFYPYNLKYGPEEFHKFLYENQHKTSVYLLVSKDEAAKAASANDYKLLPPSLAMVVDYSLEIKCAGGSALLNRKGEKVYITNPLTEKKEAITAESFYFLSADESYEIASKLELNVYEDRDSPLQPWVPNCPTYVCSTYGKPTEENRNGYLEECVLSKEPEGYKEWAESDSEYLEKLKAEMAVAYKTLADEQNGASATSVANNGVVIGVFVALIAIIVILVSALVLVLLYRKKRTQAVQTPHHSVQRGSSSGVSMGDVSPRVHKASRKTSMYDRHNTYSAGTMGSH